MSVVMLNQSRVIGINLTMPTFGTWFADLVLASTDTIPASSTLTVGDLVLACSVRRQASFAGSKSVRVVGGGNGWSKVLPAKGYSQLTGVKLSTVLNDVARECGETINVATDRNIGQHYQRERAKGERVLKILLGGKWYVDTKGVTQIAPRPSKAVTAPFTANEWSGAKGKFTISTEAISQWLPGATFTGLTIAGTQTVSSLSVDAGNDGVLRLTVLNTDGPQERLLTDIRALIRSEIASLTYAGVWEYTIAASAGMPGIATTIDATPTNPIVPPVTNCALAPELGIVAPPIAGTKCRIRFVNSDPTRPECVALGATTEHVMTFEATALLIYNVLASIGVLVPAAWTTPGLQPVFIPAMLAAIAAQGAPAPPGLVAQIAAQAAAVAAMASGTAPSTAIGPLIAGQTLFATKTLDVSGFCPGLGVPSNGG